MSAARARAVVPNALSFPRATMREIVRERYRIEKPRFALDHDGCGEILYRMIGGGRTFHFFLLSNKLPEEQKTDRNFAAGWDAMGVLCDGEWSAEREAHLRREVPKQRAGFADYDTLVYARGNRSTRLFEHVVASLAAGRQPDLALIAPIGYILRTTAFIGNGQLGTGQLGCSRDRPLQQPFCGEVLSASALQEFVFDPRRGHRGAAAAPCPCDWHPPTAGTSASAIRRRPGCPHSSPITRISCTGRPPRVRGGARDRVRSPIAARRCGGRVRAPAWRGRSATSSRARARATGCSPRRSHWRPSSREVRAAYASVTVARHALGRVERMGTAPRLDGGVRDRRCARGGAVSGSRSAIRRGVRGRRAVRAAPPRRRDPARAVRSGYGWALRRRHDGRQALLLVSLVVRPARRAPRPARPRTGIRGRDQHGHRAQGARAMVGARKRAGRRNGRRPGGRAAGPAARGGARAVARRTRLRRAARPVARARLLALRLRALRARLLRHGEVRGGLPEIRARHVHAGRTHRRGRRRRARRRLAVPAVAGSGVRWPTPRSWRRCRRRRPSRRRAPPATTVRCAASRPTSSRGWSARAAGTRDRARRGRGFGGLAVFAQAQGEPGVAAVIRHCAEDSRRPPRRRAGTCASTSGTWSAFAARGAHRCSPRPSRSTSRAHGRALAVPASPS